MASNRTLRRRQLRRRYKRARHGLNLLFVPDFVKLEALELLKRNLEQHYLIGATFKDQFPFAAIQGPLIGHTIVVKRR